MDQEQHDRQAVRIEALRAAVAMVRPGASPEDLTRYAETVEAWITRPVRGVAAYEFGSGQERH